MCEQDLPLSDVLTLINHVQDWICFKTYHDLLILADINTWALQVNPPGHILNLSGNSKPTINVNDAQRWLDTEEALRECTQTARPKHLLEAVKFAYNFQAVVVTSRLSTDYLHFSIHIKQHGTLHFLEVVISANSIIFISLFLSRMLDTAVVARPSSEIRELMLFVYTVSFANICIFASELQGLTNVFVKLSQTMFPL
ncbi:hypothetical protein WN944_013531 [Citrus x changshan-huyou]|uniref:Uncharacterized protein n=1 Tax=Citrus x changshan-huyou TaxID=2935761 RepID=A0AAP0M5C8_9ROSI